MIKDSVFNLWMETALEYEYYRKRHKRIPDGLKERRRKVVEWLRHLSDGEYRSLIG